LKENECFGLGKQFIIKINQQLEKLLNFSLSLKKL